VKITKRQLRRIIREEKIRLLRESFSSDSIAELDRAIAYNIKQAALSHEDGNPSMGQKYEDDAYQLESIKDMAIREKAAGEPIGSVSTQSYVSRLATAVRDQVPVEIYYWIMGEDY